MKKIFIALVAMLVTTISASAQSNNRTLNFDRMSNYLELTISQIEPAKKAMEQLNCSLEAYFQLQDASKGAEALGKIQASHKKTMMKVLDADQYKKYIKMFDLTIKNAAEWMAKSDAKNTASN